MGAKQPTPPLAGAKKPLPPPPPPAVEPGDWVQVRRGDLHRAWELLRDIGNDDFVPKHACKEAATRLATAIGEKQ